MPALIVPGAPISQIPNNTGRRHPPKRMIEHAVAFRFNGCPWITGAVSNAGRKGGMWLRQWLSLCQMAG
jgi:hypothetical protein